MGSEEVRLVYLLWHIHTLEDGEFDEKLLGVYSTEERANGRIPLAMKVPGFSVFPGGFEVARYVLDRDEWAEGFETS